MPDIETQTIGIHRATTRPVTLDDLKRVQARAEEWLGVTGPWDPQVGLLRELMRMVCPETGDVIL